MTDSELKAHVLQRMQAQHEAGWQFTGTYFISGVAGGCGCVVSALLGGRGYTQELAKRLDVPYALVFSMEAGYCDWGGQSPSHRGDQFNAEFYEFGQELARLFPPTNIIPL